MHVISTSVDRDIKWANLLVDSSGVVKLADFGMAKIVSTGSFSTPFFSFSLVTHSHPFAP